MEIEVRTQTFSKNSWALAVATSYEKKISHFCKTQLKFIKNEKDFLRGVEDKDLVLICDEEGEVFSSRRFAAQMERHLQSGKQKIYVIVGGPFGLSQEVKDRCNQSLSLSSFVMNQELAVVVIFEQLFRAFTIINNHPYHND